MSNRNIPAQVLRAAEEADKALEDDQRELAGDETTKSETADGGTVKAPPVAAIWDSTVVERTGLAAGGTAPVAADASRRLEEVERDLAAERHKVASLKGSFEDRLRPISDENRLLKEKLQELEKRIDEQRTPKVPAFKRHLRPEEQDAADSPEVNLTARVARGEAEEIASQTKAELLARIQELEGRVEKTVASSDERAARVARSSFWRDVEGEHPGFGAMNDGGDARWVEFLDTDNEITGKSYREACVSAMNEGDTKRFSRIVTEFKKLYKVESPDAGRKRLTSQIQPRTATGGREDGNTQVQKTYKQSEVDRFYREKAIGRLSKTMTEEQIERLTTEIETAIDEDRIVSG